MLTFGVTADLNLKQEVNEDALSAFKRIVYSWSQQKMKSPRANARAFSATETAFQDSGSDIWQGEFAQLGDYGGVWSTEVRAFRRAPSSKDIQTTIVMRLELDDSALSPVRYFVEPPAFLRALSGSFQVHVGHSAATTSAKHVARPEEVDALVREIENPERSLPVVVVTNPANAKPLISNLSEQLAQSLFALAIVTEVELEATFHLTRAIGKQMSCFDGGIRIYWPGWKRTDPFLQHPLFLAARVAASAAHDPRRPESLIRTSLLAPIVRAASSRFSYPVSMQRVVLAHRRRELEEELKEKSQREVVARLTELNQQLVQQQQLAEWAVSENAQLQAQNDSLRVELDRSRHEIEILRAARQPTEESADDDHAHDYSPWSIEDVDKAIARARVDFSTTLVIPDAIYAETSMGGGFWYHVFRALHLLCQIEREGRATNKRDQLRQLLVENVGVSKGTFKAGDTGIFAQDPLSGRRIQLRERVHLEEGRPAETESVYWQTVGEKQSEYQYLIGRIGRHA